MSYWILKWLPKCKKMNKGGKSDIMVDNLLNVNINPNGHKNDLLCKQYPSL